MNDKSKLPTPPEKGPNLLTLQGLKELLRVLLPLAVRYDEARHEEHQRWSVHRERRVTSPSGAEGYADALTSSDISLRARRELSDTVVRLLVRGHAAECPCTTCHLERRTLESLPASMPEERKGARKGGRRG